MTDTLIDHAELHADALRLPVRTTDPGPGSSPGTAGGGGITSPADPSSRTPGPSRGRFQKGNPGFGLRKKQAEEKAEEQQDDMPMLQAMRFVVTSNKGKEKTPLQRECRGWLEDDRKGFMSKLADLETKMAALRGASKAGPGQGQGDGFGDGGSDRVEDLIGRILQEANGPCVP